MATRNGKGAPAKQAGRVRTRVGRLKRKMLTLANLDGRTFVSKRVAHLIAEISSDIAAGDPSELTTGKKQLIQRAAMLGTVIESFEASWLNGEAVDFQTLLAAINSQRRVLETLKCLDRGSRVIEPLADILKRLDREREQAAEAAAESETA